MEEIKNQEEGKIETPETPAEETAPKEETKEDGVAGETKEVEETKEADNEEEEEETPVEEPSEENPDPLNPQERITERPQLQGFLVMCRLPLDNARRLAQNEGSRKVIAYQRNNKLEAKKNMDEETYKALKRIMKHFWANKLPLATKEDIKKVEGWIEETAKEHRLEEIMEENTSLEEKVERITSEIDK